MNLDFKQKPVRLAGAGKYELRTQFGALPWRIADGKVEILLITSRGSGRWIIPKGWPMDGQTPAEAAATEAFEEAGIEGKLSQNVFGFYGYRKRLAKEGHDLPIMVTVFPLKVKKMCKSWPEKQERTRKWMSRKKAASLVREPELARMIRLFDPRRN